MKIAEYAKSSLEELRKVQWPSRTEVKRLTAYVIGASLVIGLFVMFFDYIFATILNIVLSYKG
ncbi:preprotein translocase subunit SecE [candidate division WWE3 bacterium RIFOXYC1_FULL_40_10]|uniref:Protein translocase subunit SecE n=1 Tax=candidate division WWE3 bacterium RIFOXYA2_FULL_46_9 TaxID=1802636 RepID=A0A1F4W3Q0_UNCKA|nr:MAG: preprotein translocase subunit SecE [candidate division WWE3 bacterium RIFOXYB1_FULL_40_22]OGC61393.1 MAG: preprotein translocase subunit SecE [candidate division WWE3 bacterium RIFOXYA1_FULL_40_11]OGC63908.1 MAG: preprotein translocase subunit SecE [candidate division WWE3 bacterium RIFOXYA2_FULL_46_9]OGC65383.1 MAG: preprotein translocase subunit SecE [candidate division WWE3 bacterium RIFOXYB2_FULL_41_6]OGC65776.1 MAG: preprotein translocase subunit SecE [candidate division WWE3 bact